MCNQSGITFINDQIGWITADTPQEGYIGLYKTSDGGYTWELQKLELPSESQSSMFHTVSPVFFSEKDGLLFTTGYGQEASSSFVFVTHDGGGSWNIIAEDSFDNDIKWKSNVNDANAWEVTYKDTSWQSQNLIGWEKN